MLRIFAPVAALVLLSASAATRAELATARVEPQALTRSAMAEAAIEAVHQATLAARVAGRVVELAVDAGDRVRRGQVLLRIDAAEAAAALSAAEADVARAGTALANARAEFERARSLVERKFLSQSALDAARTQFQAAAAQLGAAQALRAQAATVQGYATVASPLDGVVAARHIEAGEMAQPGRVLLTVYDPAQLRAVADLAPQRLAELGDGPLQASVELGAGGRVVEAVGVTLLPAADARTHTVRARVALPAGTAGVLPGSFARVQFRAAGAAPADGAPLLIPTAAVLRRGELTAVYVADGAGGFALRQVRLGRAVQAGAAVEVLAGLKGGETIALDPVQAGIQAGAQAGAAAR